MTSRTFSRAAGSLVLTSAMISIVPGSWQAEGLAETLRGLLGLDQGLVEPARRLGIEDAAQDLHGGELGMRGGRDVIEQARPGRRRRPGAA